jgi:hypothetical protein
MLIIGYLFAIRLERQICPEVQVSRALEGRLRWEY